MAYIQSIAFSHLPFLHLHCYTIKYVSMIPTKLSITYKCDEFLSIFLMVLDTPNEHIIYISAFYTQCYCGQIIFGVYFVRLLCHLYSFFIPGLIFFP